MTTILVILYILIACYTIVYMYVYNKGKDFGLWVFVGAFWIIFVPVALLKGLGDYLIQRRKDRESKKTKD